MHPFGGAKCWKTRHTERIESIHTPSPEGEGRGEGSVLEFSMDCHENLRFSRNDKYIYPRKDDMFTPSPKGEGWGEGSILKFPMDCHENLRFPRNDTKFVVSRQAKYIYPYPGGALC